MDYTSIYNEDLLKTDRVINSGRAYQQCSLSILDTIADPDINFDKNGVSNYYYQYKKLEEETVLRGEAAKLKISQEIEKIKSLARGNKYDCIIGLSGGADSTYMAYLAKQWGLNPLLVHFDYGWNLESAVQNIERTVRTLGFDLYTYVMDWKEFRQLLRAYFKASVMDLDVPADHLIFAALSKTASSMNIKILMKGYNTVTEGVLPRSWSYQRKFDLANLQDIYKQFGEDPIKKLPKFGVWQRTYYDYFKYIRSFSPLNYVDYNRKAVIELLAKEMGWMDYGGKHCENIFTRFYQGYILPKKFHIDKRKAHYSTLIFSGQMSRDEALSRIKLPPYDLGEMQEDKLYVAKKLGFTLTEFDSLMEMPPRLHTEFKDEVHLERTLDKLFTLTKTIHPAIKWLKK